jgi:diguanylate cyclase (GGDEF)-like protein/PAS domain S-box-containing protein
MASEHKETENLITSEPDGLGELSARLKTVQSECEQLKNALRERDKLLATLLSTSPVGIFLIQEKEIVWANRALSEILGGESEYDYVGQDANVLFPSEELCVEFLQSLSLDLEDGEVLTAEGNFRREDGSLFYGRTRAQALDPAKPSQGIMIALTAHTEKALNDQVLAICSEPIDNGVDALTEEESKDREETKYQHPEFGRLEYKFKLAEEIIESSKDAIFVTNRDRNIMHVNHAFCRLTGYVKDEVLGKDMSMFAWNCQVDEFSQKVWQELDETGKWDGEVWDRRKSGESYPKFLSLRTVRDDDGQISFFLGFFSDLSEIKETEQRLQRLAHYDHLTGLPNRLLFHDRLYQALVQAKREKSSVAIMLLDLDRFKAINDVLGHRFGDRVLVEVGKRIRGCLRDSDTVARLGGDEFTVVLPSITGMHGAARVAQKITDVLSEPVLLEGREAMMTTSIGITLFPEDSRKMARLLQNADTALHYAKKRGKNNFQFFSKEMNLNVLKRLKLEQVLRDAISQENFLLHFQPIVDLDSGQVVEIEALLRWLHPDHGWVSVEKLIPIAEETSLIVPVGEWVLRTACNQNRKWQKMGMPPMRIAVNMSGRQLKEPNIVQTIIQILEETKLDPCYLEIEITESVMMDDPEATIGILEALRNQGIRISVDDFGTGYSSLSYLRDFPIDNVKIDRSFVHDLSSNLFEQEAVKAILAVAHSRELKVVAEGVESQQQLKFLKQHDCDKAQGYLMCRPLPANRFTKFLRENLK